MGTLVQKKDFYGSLHYVCVTVHENIFMSMTTHNASVAAKIFLSIDKFF